MQNLAPSDASEESLRVLTSAITACADPIGTENEWSKVLCTSAEWTTVAGRAQVFQVPIGRMRKRKAYMTSVVKKHTGPGPHPQALTVAFDEGAKLTTITRSAWLKHKDDWQTGHPAFCDDPAIGRPHGIRLQHPVVLTGFHGTETSYDHMVFGHMRLGCACYPLLFTIVDSAPADIVLGLSFRRKHNASWPMQYPRSQTMGVTSLCFGVPPGYGLFFPKALQSRYAGKDPTKTGFRQVLQLKSEWFAWQATGKRLTPAQTVDAVAGPVV